MFICVRRLYSTVGGYYAVRVGRIPGVYHTWDECKSMVAGYPKATYKKFVSQDQADQYISEGSAGFPKSKYSSDEAYRNISAEPDKCISADSTEVNESEHHRVVEQNVLGVKGKAKDEADEYISEGSAGFPKSKNSLDEAFRNISFEADECISANATEVNESEHRVVHLEHSADAASVYKYSTAKEIDIADTMKHEFITGNNLPTCPVVYTDGCCRNNGKPGAVGGVGVYWAPQHPRNISEPLLVSRPTNQLAELRASSRAIEAALEMGLRSIELRTDSMYTINSMTLWIWNWRKNGWMTAHNKEVMNVDEIKRLAELCNQINIKWVHVAGHSGVYGNEESDRLSNEGAMKTPREWIETVE